ESIVESEAEYIDDNNDTLIKLSGLSYEGQSLQDIVQNVNAYEKAGVSMANGTPAVTMNAYEVSMADGTPAVSMVDKKVDLQQLLIHLKHNFVYDKGKLVVGERAGVGFSYK